MEQRWHRTVQSHGGLVTVSIESRANPLLVERVGHTECLLGNEAIVRGALEAGIGFAAGYPGTPSSEITDGLARVAQARGFGFEYSVNEKIALEMAFAASLAGTRSICAMKHLGLMVAGDPLSTIPYIGVVGGMVIVSAGDPSCHTSPNEADQRHLGPMLHFPILDPSTPAEALAMTRWAFELSEACKLPVLIRTTTRVAHSRAVVSYGALSAAKVAGFERDPSRFVPVPAHARRLRIELKERIARARELAGQSEFLRLGAEGRDVVLASGAPAATTADLLAELPGGDKVALWRIGVVHPLAEKELVERLRGVERVLVVEELSPFIEDQLLALSARHRLGLEVLGKHSGHFPEEFEYEPHVIQRGLHAAFGIGHAPKPRAAPLPIAARPPSLCPGCPHRAAFFAARAAFDESQLYFNDIGCYTLGYQPPLETADALLCMGAGFTLASGVSRVTGARTVGFMGDSTFFHAGMPALLDAIKEQANVVAVVLDNQVTAMTGFQESPTRNESIEDVARALGAKHVETIDPYDLERSIEAFTRAKDATGTSVVVVRRACPVHQARIAPQKKTGFHVERERCHTCGREHDGLRCDIPQTEAYERNLARVTTTIEARDPGPPVAPCGTRCPLSLCIQGYAGHIAAGEYAHALGHIMARTALPHSVCRVCHRPCESACVRDAVDQPIAINDLKRFVVDWAERERPELLESKRGAANGMQIAVVGAGVAGLSAARELAVRGYGVTLFDARERPGGMLAFGIPEYRLPRAGVEHDIERVLALGVRFEGLKKLGENLSLGKLLADGYDAIFLAIGAWRPRTLELPGAGPRVVEALGYLSAVRAGQEVPRAERVVVIGGGNAAVDAARSALRLGASKVTLACLECRSAMPALHDEIRALELEGITLRTEVRPVEYAPDGVRIAPLANGGSELLPADLVILAVGQDVELGWLAGDLALDHDATGITIDPETCRTSHPQVFAGGDAVRGERSVTAAMAFGLRAAWGIDATLAGRELADRRAPPLAPSNDESWRKYAASLRTPKLARSEAAELDPATRIHAESEVRRVLAEADARREAARCLMCGLCGNCGACVDALGCPALTTDGDKIGIDSALCLGCGVCVDICSNAAIARGAS